MLTEIIMGFKNWMARMLYKSGIRPNYSTGIHGGPTAGYGVLNHNGFFEYPLYLRVATKEENQE